jgi:catechol 2,3-dioxygenase-like lactoylglutathione lyase family enzyme
MIDHIGIVVSDYARSKAFYTAALAPLGISPQMEFGSFVGFGEAGKPFFWVSPSVDFWKEGQQPGRAPIHVSFGANDRAAVDAFHAAALAAGARDNGAPGLRPHYHANFYGAFVIDPDGNNLEAVCHKPV